MPASYQMRAIHKTDEVTFKEEGGRGREGKGYQRHNVRFTPTCTSVRHFHMAFVIRTTCWLSHQHQRRKGLHPRLRTGHRTRPHHFRSIQQTSDHPQWNTRNHRTVHKPARSSSTWTECRGFRLRTFPLSPSIKHCKSYIVATRWSLLGFCAFSHEPSLPRV